MFDFLLWKSDYTIKIQLNVHVHKYYYYLSEDGNSSHIVQMLNPKYHDRFRSKKNLPQGDRISVCVCV